MNHSVKFLRTSLVSAALSLVCVVSASAASLGVGTVTADALRMRSDANTSSTILATASKDDTVVVLEDAGNDWYKVNYKSVEGYMSGSYLDVAAQADVSMGYGLVTADTLNVRSGPDTSYSQVVQLNKGSVVDITGINNGWYKIATMGGYAGYVSSDYLVPCKDSAGSRGNAPAAPAPTSSLGQQVVSVAQRYLGTPYSYGANGPYSFDCSGFTRYVYAQFGYTLNRTAAGQMSNGYPVSYSQLQPGDLLFFNGLGHVGIYVGGGQFIHASTNTYSVQYSSLNGWYSNTYCGARRIF